MILMQVRTRRGRKKKPRLVRGLMRYLVIACVIFGTAFIYVKQRNSVTKMGYEINGLRKRCTQLDQEYHALEINLTELKRPDRIRELVRLYGLNLVEVEAGQKVTLGKPDPIEVKESDRPEKHEEDIVEGKSRVVSR